MSQNAHSEFEVISLLYEVLLPARDMLNIYNILGL